MRYGNTETKMRKQKEYKESPKFYPYLGYSSHDCGCSVIKMMTNLPDGVIKKALGKHSEWSDQRMTTLLKKLGYGVEELTVADVCGKNGRYYTIKDNHLLLVGQWMMPNEGTWCLVHRGFYYHGGTEERLKPLEFFNNPIERVYVISHPKWVQEEVKYENRT